MLVVIRVVQMQRRQFTVGFYVGCVTYCIPISLVKATANWVTPQQLSLDEMRSHYILLTMLLQ